MRLPLTLEKILSDKQVEKQYVAAGAVFGDALSYLYMGRCIGFDKMFDRWKQWESVYAGRGYRTIPIGDFFLHGGYGAAVQGLRVKRAAGEHPIFHADLVATQLPDLQEDGIF